MVGTAHSRSTALHGKRYSVGRYRGAMSQENRELIRHSLLRATIRIPKWELGRRPPDCAVWVRAPT